MAAGLWGPEATTKVWKDARYKDSAIGLKAISKEEAISIVRQNLPNSWLDGWFRNADSDYKPKIEARVIGNRELRNAGLNIAHMNYVETTGNKVSFNTFVNSKITVYRGGNNDKFTNNDVFKSYSFDRTVAQKFGSNVQSIQIVPKTTLGSFQTTGEA